MKHTYRVTFLLVAFFFIAQVVGLLIINQYIDHPKTIETKHVEFKDLPAGFQRPQVENESTSFIYITIAILVGTGLVLLLVRLRNSSLFKIWIYTGIFRLFLYSYLYLASLNPSLVLFISLFLLDIVIAWVIWKYSLTTHHVWKIWFFLTIMITLFLAFFAFMPAIYAAITALIVSVLKISRPNVILQNISEIFVYGGLASIFVPILNVFAAFMLLFVISIYDYIAVNKTKHMVKLAQFQSSSKVFAGLFIPYDRKAQDSYGLKETIESKSSKSAQKAQSKPHHSSHAVAVLGGGDIGFTLIFAGAVMKSLMLKESILTGFLLTLIIPIIASFALCFLLVKGKKDKFYPAMPILSLGCALGYFMIWIITLF